MLSVWKDTDVFFFKIYCRILIICANFGRRCSNNWKTQISQHILFGILAKPFDLRNISFYTADILYWEIVRKVCLFVDHLVTSSQQYQFTQQV